MVRFFGKFRQWGEAWGVFLWFLEVDAGAEKRDTEGAGFYGTDGGG